MKQIIYSLPLLFTLFISNPIAAQKKSTDPTLFNYGNNPVGKAEFLRMYTKNINNQKVDFSEKALREYLTLYSRFKMKVAEAEYLKMDTFCGWLEYISFKICVNISGIKSSLPKVNTAAFTCSGAF
jgi:hypothetical protein